jgi:hypothetical protein
MRVQNLESLNSGARAVSGIGRDRIRRLQACLVDRQARAVYPQAADRTTHEA